MYYFFPFFPKARFSLILRNINCQMYLLFRKTYFARHKFERVNSLSLSFSLFLYGSNSFSQEMEVFLIVITSLFISNNLYTIKLERKVYRNRHDDSTQTYIGVNFSRSGRIFSYFIAARGQLIRLSRRNSGGRRIR